MGGSGRHGWLRRCGTALGSPFRGLASLTFGTVSVDLSRRQRRPYDVEDLYSYSDNEGERLGLGKMRVKAYRRMALEPYVFVGRKAQVDLAAGISLSTSGEVVPKCRLKIGDHVRLNGKSLFADWTVVCLVITIFPSSDFFRDRRTDSPLSARPARAQPSPSQLCSLSRSYDRCPSPSSLFRRRRCFRWSVSGSSAGGRSPPPPTWESASETT